MTNKSALLELASRRFDPLPIACSSLLHVFAEQERAAALRALAKEKGE